MTEPITRPQLEKRKPRRRFGVAIGAFGLLIFLLGAEPGLFGLFRSETIGSVQITIFTFGLGLLVLGGSLALGALWPVGIRTITADLGLRIAWTGYVIALASAMADVIGLGTRPLVTSTPFFGYWQERGVLVGEVVIILGFLMMIPYKLPAPPPDPAPEVDVVLD